MTYFCTIERTERCPQRGFSLVELLIALVIGTVITAGILQIFTSNNAAFRTQQAVSRVQENSRFGFRFLVNEMRHAGYTGCSGNTKVTNLLAIGEDEDNSEEGTGSGEPGSEPEYVYNFNTDIQGYYLGEEELPDFADFDLLSNDPVDGTDVIVIRRSGQAEVSATRKQPNSESANFKVEPGHSLDRGDIITVSNCRNAWVVQVTNVQGGQGNGNGNGNDNGGDHETVVINSNNGEGTPEPGNKRKLASNLGADFKISKTSVTAFYVAPNGHGGRSLYREVNTDRAEELVSGVDFMRIRYALDTDIKFVESGPTGCTVDTASGDGEVDEYRDAHEIENDGCEWARVIGAQLSLLVRSRSDQVMADGDEQEFLFFDPDNPVRRSDGHLRHQVNTTVSFRNKTL